MTIRVLPSALEDLAVGFDFYEEKETGEGLYFLENLYTDIDSLKNGGVHSVHFERYHRHLSERSPYAIYYTVGEDVVFVGAVLDCRRDPQWIRDRLK